MRLEPEMRHSLILSAAIKIANDKGLESVTPNEVARECSVKTTARTVRHYFPRVRDMWNAVVRDERADKAIKEQAVALGIEVE